jgi:ribosomal protein S12 methylthiotransferase accessory factor
MDMKIYFPGGKRVYADYRGFTIKTDQPVMGGGDDSAPAPFDLFLASIGTCAGIYVLGFLQHRGLPTEGASLEMSTHYDRATGYVDKIDILVHLPAGFPEKYRAAVINAVNQCAVKRHMHQPPEFAVTTDIREMDPAQQAE